ncbi:MAG: glycine cleavage system protein GcvH [Candidatus Omnitrophota bacterium]|nr:MAG: glycine cleavage system protein GcvH [Candidatus Omnitrophota bacterium]RKY44734.1 MAG: glycine cleavage system protein GcvH [Candidatus Omnitrophota bacterium]
MVSPQELLYTQTHEWAKIEDNTVKIGISFYLQSHLGEITFLELPPLGRRVKQFEKIAVIEAMKAVVDIHSPLSGEVIQINEKLKETPQLINSSPYQEGWLLILKIENPEEKSQLMSFEEYEKFLQTTG